MAKIKTFTVTYPDQPYHDTTADGNTFECTYTGPRYILVQVDRDDNQCREAARGDAPTDPQLDPAGYEQDEYEYVLLDAWANDDNARYAAFMTDEYTHPDVADYTEECTDADGNTWTWTHVYEGTTGMLAHIYYQDSLLYFHETNTWREPQFRMHANSRQSVIDSLEGQADAIRRALADSDQTFTDEERTTLNNHADWLDDAERKYEGINHWKWPFPETALPDWDDPNPPEPGEV